MHAGHSGTDRSNMSPGRGVVMEVECVHVCVWVSVSIGVCVCVCVCAGGWEWAELTAGRMVC